MKTNHTDDQLSAAIDAACDIQHFTSLSMDKLGTSWLEESPLRLHLLKIALANLPEPPPPVVDGKTPGHVAFELRYPRMHWLNEPAAVKQAWESAASAVIAAFGNKQQTQKCQFCNSALLWSEDRGAHCDGCEEYDEWLSKQSTTEIKAFSQPAEIPWTPWHGGPCPLKDEEVEKWEYKLRNGEVYHWNPPSGRMWNHDGGVSDIIAYRVTKWREGFGPQAVDWKAKYEAADIAAKDSAIAAREQFRRAEKAEVELALAESAFGNYRGLIVSALDEAGAPTQHPDIGAPARKPMMPQERIKALCGLSILRPIAEAGPVPAGCVRYYFIQHPGFFGTGTQSPSPKDTHFADIRLPPEDKVPEIIHDGGGVFEKVEPVDPYAALKAAHKEGKGIQALVGGIWMQLSNPTWEYLPDTYRIKPTPSTFTAHDKEWTPAVGDVVTLKSGGPKMTVVYNNGTKVTSLWFNTLLEKTFGDFLVKTLTKAD